MQTATWALYIVALLANALAIRAFFARDRFGTWKRRCFAVAAVVVVFCAIVAIVSIVSSTRVSATTMASDKARRLAEAISEIMNSAAFGCVAAVLPLVAGLVVHRREGRQRGR